jgi:predicted nucleotidyltransferase component of viral defense system
MIDRNEIEAKGAELGVHTSNVQRDYVFGWILRGIFSNPSLGRHLVLKGGNALRKAYFPNGRFSADLDFSTAGALSPDQLGTELNRICDSVEADAGVSFNKDRTIAKPKREADSDLSIIGAKLYFRDFYGEESPLLISIRLDVTEWQRLHLPVQNRNLLHDYSDASACSAIVRCVKLEEMLASKMKCLLQRRHIADLFDLVYATIIHPEIEINRREVIDSFLAKTIFSSGPGAAKELLLQLPMAVLKGLWEKYIVCPIKSTFDCERAEVSLKQLIESIFQGFSTGDWGGRFFPSRLRNPILDAGRAQTILDITYNGLRRMVEPYTLTYKRRKDGVAREYLGVWDRTGGSSPPGFKWMVADQVGSIANTTEVFEPRYEIELSKAGESFGSTGFSTKVKSFSSTHLHSVACPVCGKRFRRAAPETSIRPHRSPLGYECSCRRGYLEY